MCFFYHYNFLWEKIEANSFDKLTKFIIYNDWLWHVSTFSSTFATLTSWKHSTNCPIFCIITIDKPISLFRCFWASYTIISNCFTCLTNMKILWNYRVPQVNGLSFRALARSVPSQNKNVTTKRLKQAYLSLIFVLFCFIIWKNVI